MNSDNKFVCGDITVLYGDCHALLRTLPEGCTVVLDPPFTMMTTDHLTEALTSLNYLALDVIALTNPLTGYIRGGKLVQCVPELATTATEWHRHQRPLDAIVKLIALTKGMVLDPYCGSGTTLIAAHTLGRASIGIECDRRTFERCRQRVEESRGYGGLFS